MVEGVGSYDIGSVPYYYNFIRVVIVENYIMRGFRLFLFMCPGSWAIFYGAAFMHVFIDCDSKYCILVEQNSDIIE